MIFEIIILILLVVVILLLWRICSIGPSMDKLTLRIDTMGIVLKKIEGKINGNEQKEFHAKAAKIIAEEAKK